MAVIGRAYVELHGRTGQLERDIEKALKPHIKRVSDDISRNIRESVIRGFKDVKSDELEIEVSGVGDRAAKKIISDINDRLKETLKLNVEFDGERVNNEVSAMMSRVKARVESSGFQMRSPTLDPRDWKFPVALDDSAYQRVKQQMDDLKNDYAKIESEVFPDVDTLSAELVHARLAWLTRPRTVRVGLRLSPGSVASFLTTLAAALSGARLTKETFSNLWDLVKNLDKNIPKISGITTLVATLAGWLTAGISNLTSLLLDVSRLVGLLIPLPGILAGMIIGLGITIAAFKDFGRVLPQVGVALSNLQRSISTTFWSNAFQPIKNATDTLLPEFSRGSIVTASILGTAFGSLATSLERSLTGQMGGMFAQLGRSINITARFTDQFSNIIFQLGQHGADYLPRIAEWFGRISTTFSNWLNRVRASGELKHWTDQAIIVLDDLGEVIKGTARTFYGIAVAAEAAGGSTLRTLGQRMQSIADVVNREPFKSQLTRVFQSAHEMMRLIAENSGPAVTQFFNNLATIVSKTFRTLGPAVGDLFRQLATALSGDAFTRGFNDFISGIASGVSSLSSSFPALGAALGSLGEVIGEMARQFGPLLASVLITIADLFRGIAPALIPVIQALSGFLQIIAELPAPILIMGAALFYLHGPLARVGPALAAAAVAFMQFRTAVQNRAALEGIGPGLAAVAVHGGRATAVIRAFGIALKTAFVTNLPLLAVTGILMTLGHFAVKSAEAERKAQELADTMDDVTGEFTEASRLWTIEHFSDSIKSVRWDNLEELGYTLQDITVAAEQGPEALAALRDAASSDLNQMRVDAHNTGQGWKDLFSGEAFNADNAQASLAEFVVEIDNYLNTSDAAIAQHRREAAAREAVGIYAKDSATALAAARLEEERATQVRTIATGAIEAQITSLQQLIGLQHEAAGKTLDYREAMRRLEQSYDDVGDSVKTWLEKNDQSLGAFDITSQAGRDLQAAFDGIADATFRAVDAAKEQGQSQEQINTIIAKSREAFISYATGILGGTAEAKKAAEDLADSLGLIPNDLKLDATLDPNKALFALNDLRVEIDKTSGKISIDGETRPAYTTLGQLIGNVNEQTGTVDINGNPYPAELTIGEFLSYSGTVSAEIAVDANTNSASAGVRTFTDMAGNTRILMPINANVTPAEQAVADAKSVIQTSPGVFEVVANVQPAQEEVDNLRYVMQTSPGVFEVVTDTNPVTSAIDSATGQINNGPGATVPVRANTAPLTTAANSTIGQINGQSATVNIQANGAQATARRNELVASINNASATIRILADGRQAAARRNELLGSVDRATGTMRILADGRQAASRRNELIASINNTRATLMILANGSQAAARRRELISSINGSSGTMKYYANTNPAQAAINNLIYAANRRTATVTVYARTVAANAVGNIYESYARGGVRERHVAQIARVQRVWAEPETGGEAYIPLALSKRSRSLDILKEVARIMGLAVVPRKHYNFGGIVESGKSSNLISQIKTPTTSGKPSVVYNQTINYPVAEKTSKITNRTLQFAANIGQ